MYKVIVKDPVTGKVVYSKVFTSRHAAEEYQHELRHFLDTRSQLVEV